MGKLTFEREAIEPYPKKALEVGEYYIGRCRNACVARWDGEKFWHWREKWGAIFKETIKHREDDEVFDVFDAWMRVPRYQVKEITFEE